MAARRNAPRAKKNGQSEWDGKHCRDCALSYDWHDKAHDGSLILCRCPHKQQGGKFCIFLSDRACEKFVQRTEGGTDGGQVQ